MKKTMGRSECNFLLIGRQHVRQMIQWLQTEFIFGLAVTTRRQATISDHRRNWAKP